MDRPEPEVRADIEFVRQALKELLRGKSVEAAGAARFGKSRAPVADSGVMN